MGMYVTLIGLSAVGIFGALQWYAFRQETQRVQLQHRKTREKQEEELGSLRRSLSERHAEVESRKKTVASLNEEIEKLSKKVLETERNLEAARKQNQTLTERTKGLNAQKKQLETDLQRTKVEQKQVGELLEVRTNELKGAQTYLTKADVLSGADVIKLVEELNAEIMQTAATMAEELAIEEKRIDASGKEQESDEARVAISRTEEIIGPRMTELLRISEHHEDSILVQIAFQTAMAAYTHWMISSWCFESPEDEHMLSEIYARVREAEEQAVSGRWRQLTRTHLQRMLAQEPELLPDLAEALANVIVAAGFKDGPTTAHERIMTQFSQRIGNVMKLAQSLNKKVGEGVTSCDLEVLYIAPDIPFNAANMEDALGPTPTSEEKESVVCTTDLGLVRAERLSGPVANWHESVLLRPKVILPSGLVGIVGGSDSG